MAKASTIDLLDFPTLVVAIVMDVYLRTYPGL